MGCLTLILLIAFALNGVVPWYVVGVLLLVDIVIGLIQAID